MGYTNYWYQTRAFTDKEWYEIKTYLLFRHNSFELDDLDKEIKKDQLIYKELLEIMYKDFDMSLREIGVGDLSVGKKIYQMTEAFSGRLFAYRKFNNKKNLGIIEATIKRNIYGTIKNIDSKCIETIKSYIIDSMKYIDKSLLYEVSENSSIFIDINR